MPWTKPSPDAFRAAMDAVGVTDPARCVYVGDRLFDDVWGAQHAGMRAIHVPHSAIPAEQVGHTEGEPDAVAHRLADIPESARALALRKRAADAGTGRGTAGLCTAYL
ncbi:HAD family hydrolase [Nocardioides convexus]|uniref:HAD family hydrolase n=1 Tax=Nocardioides convexus TaxID=2712224 RepID=UPI00241867BB|nr:HAD family hydrolase [Nocardioides convexus]